MPRGGGNHLSTALWVAAAVFLFCLSPFLFSETAPHSNIIQRSTTDAPIDSIIARRDAAAIPDSRRSPGHSNPLKLPPHEPLLFEEPSVSEPEPSSSSNLTRRSASLSRRDGPLYCHDGPCIDGSCCGPDNICGFGPDFCGEGCRFNCTATAMCGEHSEFGQMPCGMKLCCSSSGWCGSTEVYCHNADPLRGTLPCQAGYGSCYITGPPSCPYGGGTTSGRHIGYYQSWNVRNRLCNKVSPRQLNTTGYTHLFYSFASIDPSTFRIAHAHPDDPAMMREFTGLAKPGLKTWIAIGGFDFSDKGTPTHRTWSEMVASRDRRAVFISSVKDYMDEYGFTGVDIDWEYPGDPERGGNKLADTQKLVLLMKEMRAAYGSNYGISLTLAPDYWYLRWFDAKAMEPYVDFFGFMAYDLHGPWDADVKALGSKVRGQADIREISENTKPLWFDGLNPAKLNFGLALYGRGYTLADPTCNQLLCPFAGGSNPAPCTNFEGVMSLHEIQQLIDRKGLTPQYLPDAMMKQITWDDQWIGYDDDETFAAKKAWADSRCFGGTMVWSIDFQVAGSGDSDDQKYGDVVYIGQEVFETPAAQCPAPCIMVFPSSSLQEPKVLTMQPYTATLEVGTTTTTIVAVSTPSTTTVSVVNFFNHYITSGQPAGAVVTLRPSIQPPPLMLVVTGQDSETTTRTVLPPPLGGAFSGSGGGGGSGGGSSNPTSSPTTTINTTYTPRPPNAGGHTTTIAMPTSPVEDSDDSDDDDNDPPVLPGFPTGTVDPVDEEDDDDPPPPGKTRLKCDLWFFNICINWPELGIKIDWWDVELPTGRHGPGTMPLGYINLPGGWHIGCANPPCSLPWPEIDIHPGGGLLAVTPAAPTPCKPVTATLTISTTSYATTTTQGTVRTISSRTMSSEFPILGCALTDLTVSVSKTACASPQPTPRSIGERDDTLDDDDCEDDDEWADFALVLNNPLSKISGALRAELEDAVSGQELDDWTVITIDDPVFTAFIWLYDARKAYGRGLTGSYGIGSVHMIEHPPRREDSPPGSPSSSSRMRRRHSRSSPGSRRGVQSRNRNETAALAVGYPDQPISPKRRIVKRTRSEMRNYAMAHLSIPPEVEFASNDEYFKEGDDRDRYYYQRDASECQDQDVYLIESGYQTDHPHFLPLRQNGHQETLPRHLSSWWDDNLVWYPDHPTGVGSVIAGRYTGVCPEGKVRLIGTDVPHRRWDEGTDSPVWAWMLIDALTTTLGRVKSNGRGTKSVINMSFSMIVFNEPMRNMLSTLLQQLDSLGVVIVVASGNHPDWHNADLVPPPARDVWPRGEAQVPNIILVGATDIHGRRGIFSQACEVYAAGVDVAVSLLGGGDDDFEVVNGTSFAAPVVSGLVAYLRALVAIKDPSRLREFDDPAYVKEFIWSNQRRVLYDDYTERNPEPGRYANNVKRTRWVRSVWNGQSESDNQCYFGDSLPAECDTYPEDLDDGPDDRYHFGQEDDQYGDDDDCSGSGSDGGSWDGSDPGSDLARRQSRKRQAGGQCPVPGAPGNGGGGGGSDGGDVGGQDQLGPSKTFTYQIGTPSPTCTTGCGVLCTDFWCRPDHTGQPPHFTEPTRLPPSTITPAPTAVEPIPSNCISSTTTRICYGDRQGQICASATVCVATPCPDGSVCSITSPVDGSTPSPTTNEDLPPLPAPTSLSCPPPWFSTTSASCGGSGGKSACVTTTVCAVTPTSTPVYELTIIPSCGGNLLCVSRTAWVSCTGGVAARELPEPTTVSAFGTIPTNLAPHQDHQGSGEEKRAAVAAAAAVKYPRRPPAGRPVLAPAAPVVKDLSPAAPPAPPQITDHAVLQARQAGGEVCHVTVFCNVCESPPRPSPAPPPPPPDPCIKIKMTEVMTGLNLNGLQYEAEVTLNGKRVCKVDSRCNELASSTDECLGVNGKRECSDGNRIDTWNTKHFAIYSKQNDKVYDVDMKVQVFEGVWDPCNGAGFMCIATVFRGQTGKC